MLAVTIHGYPIRVNSAQKRFSLFDVIVAFASFRTEDLLRVKSHTAVILHKMSKLDYCKEVGILQTKLQFGGNGGSNKPTIAVTMKEFEEVLSVVCKSFRSFDKNWDSLVFEEAMEEFFNETVEEPMERTKEQPAAAKAQTDFHTNLELAIKAKEAGVSDDVLLRLLELAK